MRKGFFVCLLVVFSTPLFAQSSMNTSGGAAKSSDGLISYSVGQLTNAKLDKSNEGVQQPYEFYKIKGNIKNIFLSDTKVSLYPNPFKRYINIEINKIEEGFTFELQDLAGRKVKVGPINTYVKSFEIDLGELSSTIYILLIKQFNTPIKKFKIQKQ